MELNWKYNPETNILKFDLTDSIYYETEWGSWPINNDRYPGEVIHKYENGEKSFTFHRDSAGTDPQDRVESGDPVMDWHWNEEIRWMLQEHSDVVGEDLTEWDEGFMNEDGELEDVGQTRGKGINNLEEKLAVNRIGLSQKVAQQWGWTLVETFEEEGICFKQHESGEWVKCSIDDFRVSPEIYMDEYSIRNNSSEEEKDELSLKYFESAVDEGEPYTEEDGEEISNVLDCGCIEVCSCPEE